MSDQPKPTSEKLDSALRSLRDYHDEPRPYEGNPKPTGEWTEGRVFAYCESEDFKGLADAINAALDVAISEAHSEGRRKQAQYEVEHNQQPLVDALAAERDDRISWQELYEKTNDLLAAERVKVKTLTAALREVNALARGNMTGCGTCNHVIDATIKVL